MLMLLFATSTPVSAADAQGAAERWLAGFRDGIKHYQDKSDRSDYARYREEQTREIAENLVLYQRANGGWPANFDPLRILTDGERRELESERSKEDTSLDNHATYPNVEYLAWASQQTKDVRFQAAAVRGLEFLLKAQYANGGWPHSWPSQRDYRPRVTLIDGVMVGVLKTLHRAAERREPFQWLPAELVERVREAAERGDRCLLGLQVKRGDVLTGWASQYDEHSLKPTQGRSYELPALVSSETVNVLEYLMSFDSPSDEMVAAIQSGARWLEESKIKGLRIERVKAEKVRYQNHTSRDDVVAVDDPNAPPIWARFYDLDTNEPVLANRDGRRVTKLSEIERERRTGYSWYGGYAQRFLETSYPAWRARREKSATVRVNSP
jgi:PelA/Pel-15E family pectate lyase